MPLAIMHILFSRTQKLVREFYTFNLKLNLI
jgi:hypothetical protein